jgi:hypothetical protein
MIGRIESRLARLEQAAAPAVTLYAWQESEETAEQVIARRFPAGRPSNTRVIVYRWACTQGEAAGTE